jgi:hypothetical protein
MCVSSLCSIKSFRATSRIKRTKSNVSEAFSASIIRKWRDGCPLCVAYIRDVCSFQNGPWPMGTEDQSNLRPFDQSLHLQTRVRAALSILTSRQSSICNDVISWSSASITSPGTIQSLCRVPLHQVLHTGGQLPVVVVCSICPFV